MNKGQLPFGFDRPEDSPGFLLWQTTTLWQRRIKKILEWYEISHAQFVIMATLLWFEAHNYERTQVLIASWSKLDKMTVSKSLKKLAIFGLTSRSEHVSDTRAKTVTLTDKGKNLIKKLVPIIEAIDAEFFGKIPMDEQKMLLTIFSKLIKNNEG